VSPGIRPNRLQGLSLPELRARLDGVTGKQGTHSLPQVNRINAWSGLSARLMGQFGT
jgi:hypothetical protein